MKIAVAGASGLIGAHVVHAAQERGHTVVRLSRTDGVDLTSGEQVTSALAGAEAVIDVSNAGTIDEDAATAFFTTVAGNLQLAAAAQGVRHVVTLSIVGIDRIAAGYYQAKLAHEQAAAGSVPSTVLRATQFHEFAAQLLAMTRDGDQASSLDSAVQTVAAAAVAEVLVQTAEQPAQGRAADVAGPERATLADLSRAFVTHHGLAIEVLADRTSMAGAPEDALLAGPDASIVGPSFADWLGGADSLRLRDTLA